MRIRVLSDLHIGHEYNGWDDVPAVDCDATVVIGDVENPMTDGLPWVAEAFAGKPIIYVCGNHCFYRGLAGSGEENTFYQDQMARGREMAESLGITMLQNESVVIDGVRFIGAVTMPSSGTARGPSLTQPRWTRL